MYCSKCGAKVDAKAVYCNQCGFRINNEDEKFQSQRNISSTDSNSNTPNKKMIFVGLGVGVGTLMIIVALVIMFGGLKSNYYFSENGYKNDTSGTTITTGKSEKDIKKSKGKTVIITDNVYNGVSISSVKDANKLISKDSTSQKDNCPKEILQVENDIIKKYGITAVNLCEMDVDFAKELAGVFDVIYNEYPAARGHITNLTLRNTSIINDAGVIAAFMPVFNFATSDTSTTYPWVIKTQVLLSSSYFLNKSKLEASVSDGSSSGHFPPNSTIYSPVAHELGHYLSFLAMLNNYDMDSILLINSDNVNTFYNIYSNFQKGEFSLEMLKEAYNNYKNDTNKDLDFDEWRGTISKYALAKDNSGEYIYDETIAEAFHDVYLNKDNASDASKYIISVLKERIGNG